MKDELGTIKSGRVPDGPELSLRQLLSHTCTRCHMAHWSQRWISAHALTSEGSSDAKGLDLETEPVVC